MFRLDKFLVWMIKKFFSKMSLKSILPKGGGGGGGGGEGYS